MTEIFGNITLIRGDGRELLPLMAPRSYDLALADPLASFDTPADIPAVCFAQLVRVSLNQIVWNGNLFDLPETRGVICWDRMYRGEKRPQWVMAWTSFDLPPKIFKYTPRGRIVGGRVNKPVALWRWLLSRFAEPGQRILSPFGGNLNLIIAAHGLSFPLTLLEHDIERYETACRWLQEHRPPDSGQ